MPVFAERGQEEAGTCEMRETGEEKKCKFVFCMLHICICVFAYLIFVIFFTLAKFLENKIYTEKRQFCALNL